MKQIKYYGSGDWIEGGVSAKSFDEADIIIMPGGADVTPSLYGHNAIPQTHSYIESDMRQLETIERAIKSGKAIFGICRGMQLLTVRAGGWLIQHSNHGSRHNVSTFDGQEFTINSCHHQICYPYDLKSNQYELLAWAKQLSDFHIIQGPKQLEYKPETLDEQGLFKEPEIVFYPEINAIGAQNHFEWGSNSKQAYAFINKMIKEKLKI